MRPPAKAAEQSQHAGRSVPLPQPASSTAGAGSSRSPARPLQIRDRLDHVACQGFVPDSDRRTDIFVRISYLEDIVQDVEESGRDLRIEVADGRS